MRESISEGKKLQRAAERNMRFAQKRKAERCVGHGDKNRGMHVERDNIRKDERTNAEIELASIKRIEQREASEKRYYLSPRNIVNRLYSQTEAGKQFEELDKQQRIARYKLLQGLKRIVPDTVAYFSHKWGLPI